MTAAAETAHLTCHTSLNVSYKQAAVLTEAVMDVSLHFIRTGAIMTGRKPNERIRTMPPQHKMGSVPFTIMADSGLLCP